MDLYAPGGAIEKLQHLIRRSNLTPDYYKHSLLVLGVASVISLIGVSGMTALVYLLYKENVPVAILFGAITTIVNLLSATFFIRNIFDLGRLSLLRERNQSDQKFLSVRSFFQTLKVDLNAMDDTELEQFKNVLFNFSQLKDPDDEEIVNLGRALKLNLFPVEESNHLIPDEKNEAHNSIYFGAALLALISFTLFFLTGKGSVEGVFNNTNTTSDSKANISFLIQFYAYCAGICLGGIVGATTFFSSANVFRNFPNGFHRCYQEYDSNQTKLLKNLGKKVLLTIMSLLYSLYTVDLVFNYTKEKTDFRYFLYFTAPLPAFFTILNALSEVNTVEMLQNFYAEVGYYCLGKAKNRNRMLANLESLTEQINLASNRDIETLFEALKEYALIEDVGEPLGLEI
ncbi:MAG: hypothetical protein H0U73_02195 [Tatlockia sp.]|nr:hypothetical protein [Tatlockia sp.]